MYAYKKLFDKFQRGLKPSSPHIVDAAVFHHVQGALSDHNLLKRQDTEACPVAVGDSENLQLREMKGLK